MKKKTDPRHEKRIETMKGLFKTTFGTNKPDQSEIKEILASKKKIDELIRKNAPSWPIEQIAPVDLATLRLAIWELLFKDTKEPYKVVIDEAVEIAKEYGSDSSPSFINGVLGTIVEKKQKLIKSNND